MQDHSRKKFNPPILWSAAMMPAGRLVAQGGTTTAFQASTVVSDPHQSVID